MNAALGWLPSGCLLTTAALAALVLLSPSAAGPTAGAAFSVEGTCTIHDTRIGARYAGQIEEVATGTGQRRRRGLLTITRAALEEAMMDWSRGIAADMERFGAFRMQAPSDVVLATVEEHEGRLTGYGSGNIGGHGAVEGVPVQVACDLRRAGVAPTR